MDTGIAIIWGFVAVLINVNFCWYLIKTERRLSRDCVIPAHGEILYLEDYVFFRWGDIWALSVMQFGIVGAILHRWPLPIWWGIILCLVGVVLWTLLWHHIWMSPKHNPDSTYPAIGVISPLGKLHLVYFALQYFLWFVGLAVLTLMITGDRAWTPFAFIGIAGAIGYYIAFFADFRAGRFTPKH